MALYDRVIYEKKCAGCGEKVSEFQTQDTKNPAIVGVNLRFVQRFYTFCYCGTHILYERKGSEFINTRNDIPTKLRKRHGSAKPARPDETDKKWNRKER